jgi:serine/threonine-protein kinase
VGLENSENLIDDYELVNCIATGNTTQVWEVKHIANAQTYAMKLLLPEALKEAEAKAVLRHEYNVAKSLEHPNIIRVYDLKMNKKFGYFIMDHFRSGNLKSMLRSELPAAQARAKRLLESLVQALAHVHDKGWIHRDIKPDNVLLSKAGEMRLIDFSLASRPSNTILHAMTRKSAITIQGTRTYLAPELIQRKPLTPLADIYSLGIMMFEILTGFPPFRTGNPNDLLMMHVRDTPDVPSSFNKNATAEADAIVMRMIAKDPKKRPGSMHEIANELRKIQLFKEDPESLATRKLEQDKLNQAQSVDKRLDSRADAIRREAGLAAPEKESAASEKPRFRLKRDDEDRPKKPAAAPAPAAMQQPAPMMMPMPGMMPGMFPGQMPMPGMMPGMYPGQMPMPGMLPGMFPGQMPMPGMVPGMLPGQAVLPPAGGAPVPAPGLPPAPAPQPRPAPSPAPVQPRPTPPAPAPADDLPLASMDDLNIE